MDRNVLLPSPRWLLSGTIPSIFTPVQRAATDYGISCLKAGSRPETRASEHDVTKKHSAALRDVADCVPIPAEKLLSAVLPTEKTRRWTQTHGHAQGAVCQHYFT